MAKTGETAAHLGGAERRGDAAGLAPASYLYDPGSPHGRRQTDARGDGSSIGDADEQATLVLEFDDSVVEEA